MEPPEDEGAGALPEFPGLSDRQRNNIEAINLFPNLLLTLFGDNLRAILVEPICPTACRERVSISFVGDGSMVSDLGRHRAVVAERFPAFNVEDVEVVARLQAGFESNGFERAHFNPHFDRMVHRFQQLVGQALACNGALNPPG